MALRYAVLGLLSQKDMSGYDLTQTFNEQVVYFWNAHHTQIYRELQKLEDEGMVTHRLIEQSDRPDKKIYSLTGDGLQTLLQWLCESPKPPKMKNEALLRVALFHLIPPEQAISFLAKSKAEHEGIYGQMAMIRRQLFGEQDKTTREQAGLYLTLDFGQRFIKTWIDWCDDSIRLFETLQSNDQ